MLAGSGFIQADGSQSHGLGSGVVLIPQRDGARIVRADIDHAADIPTPALHVLIIARAAGHLPPAVPFSVPPIKQCVAGRGGGRQRGLRLRIGGRFPLERGRIDGDRAVFAAEPLFKGGLDLAGSITKHEGCFHLQRCAGSNFLKLVVYHGLKRIVVGNDRCNLQLYAVLHNRFINAPKIRGIFLTVVCKVQRKNHSIVSV